jgi:hypothetical protein
MLYKYVLAVAQPSVSGPGNTVEPMNIASGARDIQRLAEMIALSHLNQLSNALGPSGIQ